MAMEEQNEEATGTLGIERWVQFAFIALAVFVFWFLDHAIEAVWDVFADPKSNIVTGAAALSAMAIAVILYRHGKVNRFAREVAAELAKVTWPTRQETWAQTLVVIVVSIIAAVIIGVFDAAWSAVTDLIYKV